MAKSKKRQSVRLEKFLEEYVAGGPDKKMQQRNPPTISEQLREFILQGEMTRYAINQASGVDQSQLHRFVNGTGQLTTDSLDAVARVLLLQLVQSDE